MITLRNFVALAALLLTLTPGVAEACGGFFCNNNQPVNQAAERVVFTYDGELIHMHIRITYQGPSTEFGWILPVPAGGEAEQQAVQAELSTEELFRQLDASYAPRFQLNTIFPEDCGGLRGGGVAMANGGANDEGGDGGGGVQVLSREAVGPFDRAILSAQSIESLRAWLTENSFDIPEEIDAKMAPYIDEGRAFVVLKLLPGSDSGDIQPLRVTFLSDNASIPIRPTAVAANPDMGLIVHALNDKRAIPTGEWRHVEINEAAIDWTGGGQNYPDVVSKAVDEAGGHAFTTDYAGNTDALQGQVAPLGEALLDRVRAAETTLNVLALFQGSQDADVTRVLDAELNMPPDVNSATYLQCPGCWEDQLVNEPVDAADIADRMASEIDAPREQLAKFLKASYVTRLYSTMSPAEMTADPVFDFNGDLPEVPTTRTADGHLNCDFEMFKIVTSGGLVVMLDDGANPAVIRRTDGENVAGADVRAAAVVARMPLTGAPEIIEDNRPELEETFREQDDGGCGCSLATQRPPRAGGFGALLRAWAGRR